MTDYQKVRITSECPEFMGTDLETYGPFEEGDEVEMPVDNAEILVNRGSAEQIENGDDETTQDKQETSNEAEPGMRTSRTKRRRVESRFGRNILPKLGRRT